MIARLLLTTLLLIAGSSARALEYTDVWYDQNEPGWGVLLVQSSTFQFLAFYLYGQNGGPRWYTAQITDDGTGKYTGGVYASTGTWWAAPWNPSAQSTTQIGTATFQPTDTYHATLTFTVTGEGTFTKPLVRTTLTPYDMSGNYSGSVSGSQTSCANPSNNTNAFRGRYQLTATKVADASITLTLTFVDNVNNGLVCTVSGPLTHLGRLYQMANAQYSCSLQGTTLFTTTATVDALHPTGQGIEGHLTAQANGCNQSFHFAAVLNSLQ